MKAKEIETLKVMSQETVDCLPVNLSVDGNGIFYTHGKRINAFELITQLTKATTKANEFNDFIQKIKGKTTGYEIHMREVAEKETEETEEAEG